MMVMMMMMMMIILIVYPSFSLSTTNKVDTK